MTQLLILCCLGVVFLSFVFVLICYNSLMKREEGTEEMKELAKIIRDGANTFMKIEYRAVVIAVFVVSLFVTLFVERWGGITFVAGAVASSFVCIFGMKVGTHGNVRVSWAAKLTKDIGKTVQVALLGGAAIGIPVQAVTVLGICAIFLISGIDPTVRGSGLLTHATVMSHVSWVTTFSLGCSLVAMFNRTGGGLFTKPADISSDLVGKNIFDFPEDDSRMPNTICDFIGDLVNDIAGNASDLLESTAATISASVMIAGLMYNGDIATFRAMAMFPVVLSGGGLLACLIGLAFALLHKAGKNPARELNIATYASALLSIVIGGFSSFFVFRNVTLNSAFRFGWISAFLPMVLGIVTGIAISKITEYYTSMDYHPVRALVDAALDGAPFLITLGEANASKSALLPVCLIGISILVSFFFCGFYGVAIAAVGMLSFVATTVSIDAFGPIADNAGGISQSCKLEEYVREITDKLDAVGNTTAAIGKGFAIGAAAFSALSLMVSYVGSYSPDPLNPVLNIINVRALVGGLVGAVLIPQFEGMLGGRTIFGAKILQAEGMRQLAIPGVIEGIVKPEYEKCTKINSKSAFKGMILPSMVALAAPLVLGKPLGLNFVGGMIIGTILIAIPRAIFHGNSGGAWDNAKKLVETGLYVVGPEQVLKATGLSFTQEQIASDECCKHFKHLGEDFYSYSQIRDYVLTELKKTVVIGDTTGDTNKDVIGVDLDIFIKAMSTVAVAIVPLIANPIF